jgi:hypothetical protein
MEVRFRGEPSCLGRVRNFVPNKLLHGQPDKPSTQSLTYSSGSWLVNRECEMYAVSSRDSRAAGPLSCLDMSDFSQLRQQPDYVVSYISTGTRSPWLV